MRKNGHSLKMSLPLQATRESIQTLCVHIIICKMGYVRGSFYLKGNSLCDVITER